MNPSSLPPELQEQFKRLRHVGFLQYAADFAEAARRAPARRTFSPVPYMLFCRSIELSLKAFLLAGGVGLDELASRDLGHNLVRLLARADHAGLQATVTLTARQRGHIKKAHVYYSDKGFEYFKVLAEVFGRKQLPSLTVLAETAGLLHNHVRTYVSNRDDG